MSARDRCKRHAYTLVELVTVIGIIAILAVAVGGPTLAYASQLRARTAAARIVTDLSYVQRYAMNSRLRTWAVFDAVNERYSLYVEDALNPGKANRVSLTHPMTHTTAPIQFGSAEYGGVTISTATIGSGSEIEFDNFGKPYDTAGTALTTDATIVLSSGVTITIRPVSGLVEQSG